MYAQGTTSRVTGTVSDNSGAAVAGATVTLTNEGTGVSITTETSESGTYAFDLIQVGNYEVSVEKQGFKKLVSKGNLVSVNQPATVNAVLEVGDVSATVTVENSAEQVQTSTSGNLGSTLDQRTLESLPIITDRGRNPLTLLNFQPGVTIQNNTGGGVHVHGSRDRSFNFTLDGIDINESSAGGSNFTPLRTNPDSLEEFQVVTSNFTAELGRSSGAQVTLVTRSGKNEVFGNAFEFYRTPAFNANAYSNNINNVPRPQFVQHIFGGSVGGPIIKDKFFYFTNLQFLRSKDTTPITRIVYTEAARNGIFRYVRGGLNTPFAGTGVVSVDANGNAALPACTPTTAADVRCIATYNFNANQASGAGNPSTVGIDPAIRSVINSTPLPNNFSAGDGLNTAGFTFNTPGIEKQYDFVAKFDYNFSPNKLLYVRYAQGEQNTFGDGGANGGRPFYPGTPNIVDTFRSPKNLAVNFRWSPTSSVTNEFIFGWSKFAFSFNTPEPDPNIPFSFNNTTAPNINFGYNARSVRTNQFVDNLTWVKGRHIVKGGINFRFARAFDDRSGVAGTQIEPSVTFNAPEATFGSFALPTTAANGINSNDLTRLRGTINDFLGRIGGYSQAYVSDPDNPSQFAPAGTRWLFSADYPEYDFYIQDTWKFLPNLTFDLGLRWELKLTPTSNGRPILAPDKPVTFDAPAANDIRFVEKELFSNDTNNFSPSVGFAWDPFKDGKTSIRANYRLAYDRFATFLFSSSIFQSAPGNTFSQPNTAFNNAGNLLRNGLPSLAPTLTPDQIRTPAAFGTGSVTVIDPDLVFPEIHQFALSFQREVFSNMVLEVNYIHKRGNHLIGGYNANQVNLSATDSRCGNQTFLDAFKAVQSGASDVCLANLLTGTNGAPGTTTAFRTQFATQLATNQNAVASVAQTLATRTGSTSLTANGFSPFFFAKYPQFLGGLFVIDSNDYSRYNALEFILKRRFNRGIGFQLAYTLSKSMDTRSFDPVFTTVATGAVQSAGGTPFDIYDRSLNYAPSDFDRRHVLQGTYVFELPLGRGRSYGSDMPKILDFFIGGWQVAGNILVSSGSPFTVFSGRNTFSNVVTSTVNCNNCSRNLGGVIQENGTNYFFSAEERALFSIPSAGENGNVGRNYFVKPPTFQTDASISKKFRVTEKVNFDLRLDVTNLTNTPVFDNPTANFTSTIFGRIRDSVQNTSRRMQLGLKLNF